MKVFLKKRTLVAVSTLALGAALFSSCGGGDDKKTTTVTEPPKSMVSDAPTGLDAKIAKGKEVYTKVCQACHQADGKGLTGAFPPLAGSDYFATDKMKIVENIVNGLKGEITVLGVKYNTEMPKQNLTDEETAAVATYVLNSYGNKGGEITVEEVAKVKK